MRKATHDGLVSMSHNEADDGRSKHRGSTSNATGGSSGLRANSLFNYFGNNTNNSSSHTGNNTVDTLTSINRLSRGGGATANGETTVLRDGTGPPPASWAKDWQRIAEIVDRLFFWAFLIGVVATTLLLFHPLARSHEVTSTGESLDDETSPLDEIL